LIKGIRVFDWTVFHASGTAGTLVFINISWLLGQSNVEATGLALYPVDLSIGEYLYVYVPVDLDQFR
jgi:hypothetical protein